MFWSGLMAPHGGLTLIVSASVLVERDDEQGLAPLRAVSQCLVNIVQELIAWQHVRRRVVVRALLVERPFAKSPSRLEISEVWQRTVAGSGQELGDGAELTAGRRDLRKRYSVYDFWPTHLSVK